MNCQIRLEKEAAAWLPLFYFSIVIIRVYNVSVTEDSSMLAIESPPGGNWKPTGLQLRTHGAPIESCHKTIHL